MCNQVYSKEQYVIFPVSNGFIVHNTNYPFEDKHTHMKHIGASKTIIDLALKRKVPKSTNFYFLESLIRISEDEKYIEEIESLIEVRKVKGKKQSYTNVNKGVTR